MESDVDFPIALTGDVVDVLVLERVSAKARENDGDVNESAVCALLGAVASGAVNAYSRARTRVKCDEKRRMIAMRYAQAQAVFESFAKRTMKLSGASKRSFSV
jgi:putative sterol carrier protein